MHHRDSITTVALPVRDTVVFPEATVSLFVSAAWAIDLAEQAQESRREIFVVCQKPVDRDPPLREDVYDTGTLVQVVRLIPLADSRVKILVRGRARARIEKWNQDGPLARVKVTVLPEPELDSAARLRADALAISIRETLERIAQLGRQVSPELVTAVEHIDTPGALADAIASNLYLPPDQAQKILEAAEPVARLEALLAVLDHESQVLTIRAEIQNRAREEFGRSQREFHLREQLRAIRSELGEQDFRSPDVIEYEKKIGEAGLPEQALAEAKKQLKRLDQMHADSAESAIVKNYLDTLCELPWNRSTEEEIDIAKARKVLDEDHYDLDKIKKRIIEHLAVLKLRGNSSKGQILCFVGPPGVGKTSLGKSIARAMGRKFQRISVGGVRDEAEIRGHRRTYVGAMPGRVLGGLKTVGVNNPVFMLDEIDKVGSDFRGDPSSALLEVLDPEQNATFTDHFLGIPFDLQRVFFIATANDTSTIPAPLLDRMEVVELSGYSEEEKVHIARQYLIPKQVEANGLPAGSVRMGDEALRFLISGYTRESGLRNLDREIGSLCRKIALPIAEGKKPSFILTKARVEKLLGPVRHETHLEPPEDEVGIATGLAWTPHGGEPLYIEAQTHPGKRGLILSGHLGEVMKESANTALSYVRTRSDLGVPQSFLETNEIHVHAPEGAIPKDGPSAGIAIATALLSVLTGRKVRKKVAMTGEITLRGKVLPIGGLKEKFLAARRVGAATVVIPWQNQKDLVDIPPSLLKSFKIVPVRTMDDVIPVTLVDARQQGYEPPPARALRRPPVPKVRPGAGRNGPRFRDRGRN